MNRLVRTIIAAACIAASAGGLHAQSIPSASVSPLLDKLVGDWRMVGQVRGKPATYDLTVRRILDRRYVELHMTDVARPAQYEARVFIGEDTVASGVIVHWLDNFGAAYSIPHGNGLAIGDTLRFEIPYPGAPFRDTFVFRRQDRSWLFRLEASDGRGGWKLFAEYVVRSVRPSPR